MNDSKACTKHDNKACAKHDSKAQQQHVALTPLAGAETAKSRAVGVCRWAFWVVLPGSRLNSTHMTWVRVLVPLACFVPSSTPILFLSLDSGSAACFFTAPTRACTAAMHDMPFTLYATLVQLQVEPSMYQMCDSCPPACRLDAEILCGMTLTKHEHALWLCQWLANQCVTPSHFAVPDIPSQPRRIWL